MSSDDMNSESPLEKTPEELREEYAEAFNETADPLKQYSQVFSGLPDPFDYFISSVLLNRDTISSGDTITNYRRTYRQWREHMAAAGRHPACPNPQHIRSFIDWRRDVHGNTRRTIQKKLNHLTQAYEFWQSDSVFPHPIEFNPVEIGKKTTSLGEQSNKEYPDLTLADVREAFASIVNMRSRATVGSQLKLGVRASEVSNSQIQDVHLSHGPLQELYPELGTHPALGDYKDVIYIPPDREGNKSKVPRLIPIDEELRWLLIRHLIARPQVDEPWIFLSKRTYTHVTIKGLNNTWDEGFHPEYEETEDHRAIKSHFGRHWFSSWFRLEAGMNREHVQYMRGDRVEPLDDFPDAIDDYLHPNYEHIESTYRNNVFKLDIPMQHYSSD